MDLGERYILRKPRVTDAATLLLDIRQDDLQEWNDSAEGGIDNLYASMVGSKECYVVASAEDDHAHIIWGVYPVPEPTTWLVGTNQGQLDCPWILYQCDQFVSRFFQRWPRTVCYSAPENTVHHRWLKWMGYKSMRRVEWGAYHKQFIEFRREV